MKRWIYVVVFLFLISFVCAENNGCCQLTNAGDSCVYTTESNCVEGFSNGALCENTVACSLGCCVLAEECFENTGEYTCSINSGDFFDAQECSGLGACEMTCCKFGSDYSFMSYGECQNLFDEYGNLVEIISVNSEAECEELEDQEEKGCCVTNSGCAYVTQAECGYLSYNAEGFGFFENEYCESVASYLNENNYASADYCVCEVTGNVCDEDGMNVVEMDSCGNYGVVVEECNFPDEICIGYQDGAYCGTGECTFSLPEELVAYNPLWKKNEFQNYESRCLYEGPAGNYQDRPGSRHYIMRCLTGELVLEPCVDYREEVCLDNSVEGLDMAYCEGNTVDNVEGEVTTVPKAEKFWEFYTTGGVSERCLKGVVNCDVIFGEGDKGIGTDTAYECDANCFCLRKEWSKLMNEYCKAQGDCGNDINLAGKLSDDSFGMDREIEEINSGSAESIRYSTEIGCGVNCVGGDGVSNYDARGLQCYPGGSLAECKFYFWEAFDEHYFEDLTYRQNLLLRVTGSVYLFTLFEYAHINPNFLKEATEYDLGGTSTHDGTAAQEILLNALDLTFEEFIYFYPIEKMGATAMYSSITRQDYKTWKESVDNFREFYDYSPINWDEEKDYILGEKFILNDVIEHNAKAPEYEDKVTFLPVNIYPTCGSWVAPVAEDCELCNIPLSQGGIAIDDGHGNIFAGYECSEYRCKALGINCEWIVENEGTDRPNCINFVEDPEPLIIYLWEDKMDELGYQYTEYEDGVEIKEALVGLIQMPVLTSDFVECKISDDPSNFDLLKQGISTEEFYGALSSISEEPLLGLAEEHNFSYVLTEGGKEYTFWIYCNNYFNQPTIKPYEFSVTTTTLPDTDAPEIEGVYPNSETYVKNGEESLDLTVYLNENGYCKYSSQDIAYEQMTSEFASCAESDGIFNYVCITTIPLSVGTTTLYLRCSDIAGNIMSAAEQWYVSQSLPLQIVQLSPTGTLYTNDIVLQVKTEDGAENGKAVCYYEGSGTMKQEMFVTSGSYHEQSLNLEKGNYEYTITCEDYLGNSVTSVISFVVDKDVSAAEITGVYYLGTNVYVLTNEATSCQYKTESFSYGNGYDMGGVASTAHSFTVSDLTKTYYINCIDAYSNTLEGVKINLDYLLV